MNDVELNFGLAVLPPSNVMFMSALNARIKLMESLLRVAYNMASKTGSALKNSSKTR